jgi:hypothetical protein
MTAPGPARRGPSEALALGVVILAAGVGLLLQAEVLARNGPTYDEPDYIQVARRWWLTGDQERITRMGSPLTFWKLQQAPVLAWWEWGGSSLWNRRPETVLRELRQGAVLLWAVAMLATAAWAAWQHGRVAAMLAAWLFVLSPNLLAHGGLLTMELPLVAACAGVFFAFAAFLRTGGRWAFLLAAALAGLAFSCKFTAVLLPPLLGLAWAVELRRGGTPLVAILRRVGVGMAGFVAVLLLANLVVTGFARVPLSQQIGDHPALLARFGPRLGAILGVLAEAPWPQDWVGFLRQMEHQRNGGPGYLLGARSNSGWWYYYLVCLAVKVPLSFWALVAARAWLVPRSAGTPGDRLAVVACLATIAIVSIGSSRNYGYRYLLFLAPAAIVWISALARAGRAGLVAASIGLAGQAIAVASCHPYPLTYFPLYVGGPEGGKALLADSNLDWGQGVVPLAERQREEPAYADLTFYYFGNDPPRDFGVQGTVEHVSPETAGTSLLPLDAIRTPYVAVSRSLQHGPWGPPGFFRPFDALAPVAVTADGSIALYRTADLPSPPTPPPLSPP